MISNFFNRCSLLRNYGISQSIVNRVNLRTHYYEWSNRKFLFPVIAITGLICCAEYKRKYWHWLPAVSAARPTFEKGNREKFNFIANVVNHVAPAVVYIEIKDLRMKDYVTRWVFLKNSDSKCFSTGCFGYLQATAYSFQWFRIHC